MHAGLLTYKLCDRDFDCDHCPLHAALRGCPAGPAPGDADPRPCDAAASFPPDRFYTKGHTWLQPLGGGDGRLRFGVDSFATNLIARPRHVRLGLPRRRVRRGERLCEIECATGAVPLNTPISARVDRWNPILADDPAALAAAPYGEGWIVELDHARQEDLRDLLDADAAREQAWRDARLFRRHLALQLLTDEGGEIPPPPQRDAPPTSDLRQIIGAVRFLALVHELVH